MKNSHLSYDHFCIDVANNQMVLIPLQKLLEAVKKGDLEKVKSMINNRPDLVAAVDEVTLKTPATVCWKSFKCINTRIVNGILVLKKSEHFVMIAIKARQYDMAGYLLGIGSRKHALKVPRYCYLCAILSN